MDAVFEDNTANINLNNMVKYYVETIEDRAAYIFYYFIHNIGKKSESILYCSDTYIIRY